MSTSHITVAIVEDHPTFRLGLSNRLAQEPDLTVVAEVGDGDTAIDVITEHRPDVALVDLNLPGMDGVSLIRALRTASPDTGALVLTMLDDDSVFVALQAGARGYLLKDAQPSQIVAAIRTVASGDLVLAPATAERLLGRGTATSRKRHFPELSDREHDVLELLGRGLTNTAIGRELGLTDKTVRNYVSNVITKLQARTREEAAERARDSGLA